VAVEFDAFAESRTNYSGARDLYREPYDERARRDSDAFADRMEANAAKLRRGW
jgi:hypothetical protein